MTLKEFFAIAKQATWYFNSEKQLRTKDKPAGKEYAGQLCPLAYVTLAVSDRPNWTAPLVQKKLNFPDSTVLNLTGEGIANKIISGADEPRQHGFNGLPSTRNQNRRWLARNLGIWKR